MELNTIKDAFDRVSKKQKLSCSNTREVIDQIGQEIEQALVRIQSANNPDSLVDHRSILAELKTKIKDMAPLTQLESTQKELNAALSKYPKLLEKSFNPDISKAYRNIEFNTHVANQIIASHFYQQDLFKIGDLFLKEANEPESADVNVIKYQFKDMYQMLEAMKGQNLEPALKWAAANADKLKQNGSDLILKLHSLQFLEILQKGSKDEALKYARTYLSPFASDYMDSLKKLVVCILWTGKLDRSPYCQLMSSTNRDKVAKELTRQFCKILEQSYESPLGVTINAGAQGLPPLLKFMNVMAGKKQEWQTMKQLPVPVELEKEYQFHSIFVCPVSKEQSTEENIPMLMSCGHVLCKQSIMKMSKNSTRSFKCPYCPSDIDATHCKQLCF
ncbi:hypothetical protein FNV43_RR17421 [Rhamnella rubrinervis]|uniref:Uncharacterized protein n=1 Tax=Rhamnella rubrinervis TaxID=2594499 RepID=A0A8K0DYS0_9ROSA|nr:hypothetical protein FNV43_RR17421 [Rhamnella rubrinervis]